MKASDVGSDFGNSCALDIQRLPPRLDVDPAWTQSTQEHPEDSTLAAQEREFRVQQCLLCFSQTGRSCWAHGLLGFCETPTQTSLPSTCAFLLAGHHIQLGPNTTDAADKELAGGPHLKMKLNQDRVANSFCTTEQDAELCEAGLKALASDPTDRVTLMILSWARRLVPHVKGLLKARDWSAHGSSASPCWRSDKAQILSPSSLQNLRNKDMAAMPSISARNAMHPFFTPEPSLFQPGVL